MKKLIVIVLIILGLGGIGYWVWSQGYIKNIIPGSSKEEYKYKDEDLKKISEEAGINLEKGMVEEKKEYNKQREDWFSNKNNIVYRTKTIVNEDNNKEWLMKIEIPFKDNESKYGLWKVMEGKDSFIGELGKVGYEQWEYRSVGVQDLKGSFKIGGLGEGNTIKDIQYIIEK